MGNWIAKAADLGGSTWNVVRSIGPFIISQSDTASEAYARHQSRLAHVEAGKEFLMAEARSLSDVKGELRQRYIAADMAERLRIKGDLREIDANLRQLKVGQQALSYISTDHDESGSTSTPGDAPAQTEPTQHWMDKFSELARTHNELWREDLLARALAKESAQPGSVSTRALWLLGTMEKLHFEAFATVLDLCSEIGGLMVPSGLNFDDREIPGCPLGPNVAIGHLLYKLEDVGLIANLLQTARKFKKGEQVNATYGSNRVLIECKTKDYEIGGVILSELGTSIASFCDRKFNPLGKEIFDAWLASLNKELFNQTVIDQQ